MNKVIEDFLKSEVIEKDIDKILPQEVQDYLIELKEGTDRNDN